MINPITLSKPHLTSRIFPQEIHLDGSLIDNLKAIGLIDDQFNVLFTPDNIPEIKNQERFNQLLKREVQCCNADGEVILTMTEAEYINGFSDFLAKRGFKTKTYLRGGYAAYVAGLDDYLIFLIQAFLKTKKIPFEIKREKEEVPHDVDLFDYIVNEGISPTALRAYFLEFINNKDVKFIQLLIPQKNDVFPNEENYVLFTLGNPKESFQTDRIIGRLNQKYLFTRDDIHIEITSNQLGIPKSAGNFWQMVIDRKLKIIRTEPRHETDFRAGLAALQLMLDDHILIEDKCPLEWIFRYALKTGSKKIFTGALDRAKLHGKNSRGLLYSVMSAYLHTAKKMNLEIPLEHLEILGEQQPLAQLYKHSLLLTLYQSDLQLERIIFPKGFSLTSIDKPSFSVKSWVRLSPSNLTSVYEVLEGDLHPLERVLFELALQKQGMPLTDSMKNALVDYLLISQSDIENLLAPWIIAEPSKLGWTKALLRYSFKHGYKLWTAFKDLKMLEEIIPTINPNYAYLLLEEEKISYSLRIRHLKTILSKPDLSISTALNIVDEFKTLTDIEPPLILLLEKLSIKQGRELWQKLQADTSLSQTLLQAMDRFISFPEDEEWFSNSNPTQGRITALYLKSEFDLVTKIRFIKKFKMHTLAKEWIAPKPQSQALLFFSQYDPSDLPLLEYICSLPGVNEKNLLKDLHTQGHSIFSGQPVLKLLAFLKSDFTLEMKKDVIKNLPALTNKEKASLKNILKESPLELVACMDKTFVLNHLLYLKSIKKTSKQFDDLWLTMLDQGIALLPFYRDRRWVQAVYGDEAEAKTKDWGNTLLLQENLSEIERESLVNILSRTTLIYNAKVQLIHFLQPFYTDRIRSSNLLKPLFEQSVSSLSKAINQENPVYIYSLERLLILLKLGLKANVCTFDEFLYDNSLKFPNLFYEDTSFDVHFDFVQTIPLLDFDTPETYAARNDKRISILPVTQTLKILSYELMQKCADYAHQFKLITEQYITNKVSLEEFQEEVRTLSKFKTKGLNPTEDPSLICIDELCLLLKYKSTRIKAYEAFHFLLKCKAKSPFTIEFTNYLNLRKCIEDLIRAKGKLYDNQKITYGQYLTYINQYVAGLTTSLNPFAKDPVCDAFELESIPLIDKMDMYKLWRTLLEKSDLAHNVFHARKLEGCIHFNKGELIEKDVEPLLIKRAEALKTLMKKLDTETIDLEIEMIAGPAIEVLPTEKVESFIHSLEKILGLNMPLTVTYK